MSFQMFHEVCPEIGVQKTRSKLTKNLLIASREYVERIKRHYALFREKVDE